MSRTTTKGSVDLQKFPTSRVRQLAKKIESSKAKAHHIKQVAGDQQATQINLLRCQRTELPTTRHNEKRSPVSKQRQSHHMIPENQVTGQVKNHYDNKIVHKSKDRCNKCGNSTSIQGFHCPAKKYQCKVCHKYGHFSSLCYQKKNQVHHNSRLTKPKAHQLKAGPVYVQDSSICGHSKESSFGRSFCLQLQAHCNQVEGKKIPNPVHLITNIAYRLKPYHNRNMYLQARLDTCADVYIILASVYHLVFKDPKMKKLAPCNLKISTYTADTVNIVGSCTFYVVHPDSKKVIQVTFYVATNDGSILLPCKTTLALHLIQPRS